MEIQKLQVFEKLKQLREWQEQQQENLLKQQENELKALKKEQDAIRKRLGLNSRSNDGLVPKVINEIVPVNCSTTPTNGLPRDVTSSGGKGSLQPHGHTASGSSIVSNDSGMLSGHSSSTEVEKPLEEAELDHSSGFDTPTSELSTDDEDTSLQTNVQNSRHHVYVSKSSLTFKCYCF